MLGMIGCHEPAGGPGHRDCFLEFKILQGKFLTTVFIPYLIYNMDHQFFFFFFLFPFPSFLSSLFSASLKTPPIA